MTWNQTLIALLVGALIISSNDPLSAKELDRFPGATLVSDYATQGNASLWNHLRTDFNLNHQRSAPGVESQRQLYLKHSYHLNLLLKRSTPYLYFISAELERRNLPAELVLIPLIESAYDPYAVSSSNAAGLWQMVPDTGTQYGLTQNRGYDGRHDIFTSTHAALNYLTRLNKLFKGDWALTIAAYNTGEGNLLRAINRNIEQGKSTDFWSLRVATETRVYVQRFLALADIIANSKENNLELPHVPNRPALVLINTKQQTDLKRVADVAGISLPALHMLNAGYTSRRATPTQGPHHLLVPVNPRKPYLAQVAQLQKNVKATAIVDPNKIYNNDYFYKVRKGDTLITIADRYDITVAELRQANRLSSTLIKTGQELFVPDGPARKEKQMAKFNVAQNEFHGPRLPA
jgi:membrane-bound lytic murein transglycosylase D